mgnify:CR=1 FL=1
MITSSGVICDVCDGYILLDKSINPFSVKGIERELHCHDDCKIKVLEAEKDWHKLPDGSLKKAFEEHEKIIKSQENKEIKE